MMMMLTVATVVNWFDNSDDQQWSPPHFVVVCTYTVVTICPGPSSMPFSWAIQRALTPSYNAVPSMFTVAPSGSTKRLMRGSTLFRSSTQRMVVGRVAELQEMSCKLLAKLTHNAQGPWAECCHGDMKFPTLTLNRFRTRLWWLCACPEWTHTGCCESAQYRSAVAQVEHAEEDRWSLWSCTFPILGVGLTCRPWRQVWPQSDCRFQSVNTCRAEEREFYILKNTVFWDSFQVFGWTKSRS